MRARGPTQRRNFVAQEPGLKENSFVYLDDILINEDVTKSNSISALIVQLNASSSVGENWMDEFLHQNNHCVHDALFEGLGSQSVQVVFLILS